MPSRRHSPAVMTATPEFAQARRLPWYGGLYPYALLLLANLFWASNWVMGRAIHETFPPVALSFWRWTCAALLLAPFALPRLRGKWPVIWRNRWLFLAFGLTGVATFQSIIYAGLNYTTTLNATLVYTANPLVMICVAWLIDRQRTTPRQLAGMILTFIGVVPILAHGDLASLRNLHFNTGDILVFISMPIWCLYCVLLRRRPLEIGPTGFMFVVMIIGITLLAPVFAYESVFVRSPVWTAGSVGAVIFIAITSSIGAYIFWNRGVELVGPNKAAFTGPFQPAFAALLAVILLGERFELYHAVGFAMIFAGWLLTTDLRARR